ncbi:MAG TPA: type VI secretion system baseplate subunit TssK [Longimicrobium sp.]|uniref:type VI secretion system baseplate subunit TssK n=1 Tax=Longimicrobium sp. TaxID=2029185 RepID=UPI002ED7B9F1
MTPRPPAPRSVNWTTGMLLTPDHFRIQDAYADALVGWVLRYCVPGTGLVGGGVRLGETERGLAGHDPRLQVADDGETVRVAVLEARGITPSGEFVEVGGGDAARGEFRKADLAGLTDVLVYLVRGAEKEEDPASVGADAANPAQAALRRASYRVALGADGDAAAHALAVGRLRRASETLAFEPDARFIPPCATVLAHSELYAGWAGLHNEVVQLAGRYAELHRSIAWYAEQVAQRGVDAHDDREVLAFVERAVLALDGCAYETLDPAIPPDQLFREVERAGRRIAVALDLSAATRHFFQTLSGADASYAVLLEEERQALARGRERRTREELRPALERAGETLTRLRRLCDALEGKYLDFRVNRALDTLKFLLDRGGEHFYIAVATPGHPQRDGDLLTFVFSHMSLTGRHEYRVVLLGDPHGISEWQVGEELRVDLRVNAAAGPSRPISRSVQCEIPGQRNFAVNFDTPPEVATVSGLQVTVQPGYRVRAAVLYQRRLGLASEATPAPPPPVSGTVSVPEPVPAAPSAPAPLSPPAESRTPRIRLRKP